MRIICSSGYPWDADPDVTHSWVMDPKYITLSGSSITNVAPQKGNVPLPGVATHYPTVVSTWGSQNKGAAIFDGVSQYLTAHPIAALVSGTNKPWTITMSVQVLTVAQDDELFRFQGSGSIAMVLLQHKDTLDPAQMWVPFAQNDAGVGQARPTSVLVTTAKHALVIACDGVNLTMLVDNVVIATGPWGTPIGAMTVSQLFVGGGITGLGIRFSHMALRSMQFAAKVLSPASHRAISSFSLAEAA